MNSRTERSFNSAEENMREEFNRGAGNARSAARDIADAAEDAARSGARKGSRAAARAADTASDLAETGAEHARSAAQDFGAFTAEVEDAIRRNPLSAVGVAFVCGLAYAFIRRKR